MDKLPKARKFSGEQQVQILVDIAKSRETIGKLTTENKLLKKQNVQLEEAFDLKKRIHDELNKDYIAVRDENKSLLKQIETLEAEVRRLLHDKADLLNTRIKYRATLEYYGNTENYKGIPLIKKPQVMMDNGEFARYVLDGESNE